MTPALFGFMNSKTRNGKKGEVAGDVARP